MSERVLSHDVPKGYSSIVSEDAMNSFNEMFPSARMFPLAVMHPKLIENYCKHYFCPLHVMHKTNFYWHCIFYAVILYFFIFYHDDYNFEKQSLIKPCLFHWGNCFTNALSEPFPLLVLNRSRKTLHSSFAMHQSDCMQSSFFHKSTFAKNCWLNSRKNVFPGNSWH